jgi:hypothetical protein
MNNTPTVMFQVFRVRKYGNGFVKERADVWYRYGLR